MELSFPPRFIILMLLIIPILKLDKPIKARDDDVNEKYQKCKESHSCGGVEITYPFFDGDSRPDYCGHPGFSYSCNADQPLIPTSALGVSYHLMDMDSSSHTISVVILGFWDDTCLAANETGWVLHEEYYKYNTSKNERITLYYQCGTPKPGPSGVPFPCPTDRNRSGYFTTPELESQFGSFPQDLCRNKISVPFNKSGNNITDLNGLQTAFEKSSVELEWYAENGSCDECRRGGGECGWDHDHGEFSCHCPPTILSCYRKERRGSHHGRAHDLLITQPILNL